LSQFLVWGHDLSIDIRDKEWIAMQQDLFKAKVTLKGERMDQAGQLKSTIL
jgi:hypothetical protein